ncbi:hypothetical protein JTB14_006228 [Gonioctena quinquepunctata]|nr:hypothetical protein JTB14_006228 [Gonioctena quinquepunctata]
MDNLLQYFRHMKQRLKKLQPSDEIHIVVGNESCDIDSSVSSVILAYLLNKSSVPKIAQCALVVPIQNVTYEQFLQRADNCLVYKEAGIPLDLLVYRDELDLDKLCKTNKVTTSLVDHHVLSNNERVLEDTVVQIFDHRPRDLTATWSDKQVEINIRQVGSCSTLIAEKILSKNEAILFREIAYMIYETIIYDTVALLPENGRATELDLHIAKNLRDTFQFDEDTQLLYKKLWTAHIDVSHLTPRQMLDKDMKVVENVPVPGLPMLVDTFLKLKGAHGAIETFADDHKVDFLVLVGLDASKEVKRDLGLFWRATGDVLRDRLLRFLWGSQKLKGYDFCLSEIATGFSDIVCLKVNNVKLSRKQIVPLIKDAVLECK